MTAHTWRTTRISRRRTIGWAGSATAAAFLAACGGDDKEETPASNQGGPPGGAVPAQATSAAQAQSQGTPKPGGVVRYHLPKEPGNLDPHLATDSSTTAFSNMVYNTMLRFKTGPNVDTLSTELEGDLAQSWETPDTSTVTLKLRQGLTWHNKPPLNGRAFTAEDAKAGILRIGTDKPEFQRASFFKGIDRIETPDAQTVVIKQKSPNVPFLTYLAVPYHKIISRDVIEKEGDAKTVMVGTGPFTLESYTRGGKAVFKKNPDYFKKDRGLPYLDGVELTGVLEVAARVAAYRSGDTDIIRFENPTDLDQVKSIQNTLNESYLPLYYSMPFGFDVSRPPYDDARVRQAMALVIDHPGLRRALFKDQAVRLWPIPSGFKDWLADQKDLEFYDEKPNLARAKELMKAAGHENGFKAVLDTNTSYTNQIDTMPYLRDMLKPLGIDVTELKKVEPAAFLGATNVPGGFEMRIRNHSAFSEVDEFVTNFYTRGASRNFGAWGSEKLDGLIAQQRNLADKAERKKVLVEIQKELARENWRIGLEQWFEPIAWYNKVKGFRPLAADPGYQTLGFEHLWLDR